MNAPVATGYHVKGPAQLYRLPEIARYAERYFADAITEGVIRAERDPLDAESYVAWVAGDSGVPNGVAVFYEVQRRQLWLDFLYVVPQCRRSGIASALLADIAAYAAKHHRKRVLFGTGLANAAMIGCARKAGYAEDYVVFGVLVKGAAS